MTLQNKFAYVELTDVGKVRDHNEDAIGSNRDTGLLVLADGMGGYNAGEVASGIAIKTVLELVNKIGSAFYGPILATFWLGMLTKRGNQKGAIIGLVIGVGFNIFLWKYYGSAVSWLWWNVFGFVLAFGFGYIISRLFYEKEDKIDSTYLINYGDIKSFIGEKKYYYILTIVFILIILSSFLIQLFLSV